MARHGSSAPDALTAAELDVLRWIAQGHSNAEIASLRGVSIGTIKTQVPVIFEKLRVDNRVQAAIQALKQGLLKLEDL